MPRLFGPTATLININVKVLSSLALFERIFDYLDIEPDISDRPGALDLTDVHGSVELRDVEFAYVTGQPVLQGVSLRISRGSSPRSSGRRAPARPR